MKHRSNINAYTKYVEEQSKELEFWASQAGVELQLNLVAQGHEYVLWSKLTVLLGSGFCVLALIKRIRREINDG